MIALYHNALSTCSQKVRLVLAEKGLDFESRDVDLIGGGQHDADYVKLNPKHVVPTLVHDDRVLIESSLIIRYLDDIQPEPPLRPAEAADRYAVDLWIKRVDEELHPAAPAVTFAVGPRPMLMAQPEEVREARFAAIPDPIARAARRSVEDHGVKSPEFERGIRVFVKLLDLMESDLADQPWLSGAAFGLADASLFPYVIRIESLAMDPLLAARPRVGDWLARLRARPSYATAVEAWLAPPILEMFRKNGEQVWADVEPLTR